MFLKPWLSALRNRVRTRRTNQHARHRQATEQLEERTLLTVTTFFFNNELSVVSDRNDAITVRSDINGDVEVLDDGILLNLNSLDANQVQRLVVVGGDDDNTIDVSGLTSAAFTALTGVTVQGGDGDDNIIGSNDFGETIDGDDGNDTINGSGGDDVIDGDDGNDVILGGTGNDILDGGDGQDDIMGELGADTIDAGDGDDTVSGGTDMDSIDGGQGDDVLDGGDGNDSINGSSGNDNITGSIGDDTLLGGANDDTMSGGDGTDSMFGNGGADSMLGDSGDDFIDGGSGGDDIDGGLGDDAILGGAGNDTAQGGQGDDNIIGGGGNDNLNGDIAGAPLGTGNDVVLGNSGNDTLSGGGGADFLRGDRGNDLIFSGDIETDSNPVLLINNATVLEGASGNTPVTLTVSLQQVATVDVSVDFATADGTATLADGDYLMGSGTVTIPAGQLSTTITVNVVGDTRREGNEDFTVQLSNSVNGLIGTSFGQVLIQDDDVWVPVGGAPIVGGQSENVPQNNPVSGAVHAVVAHPTDPDILYIGAVNGGVWRTTNATSTNPNWVPLTDEQASLAIGALAMDPTDPNTLIAGIGSFSSFSNLGGGRAGLQLTRDGGDTFTAITDPLVVNEYFSGVSIRGNLILAASNNGIFFPSNSGGLFRSTDGGTSFTQVSGTGGLPNGNIFDLVSDPSNPNRYYVTLPGVGLFRSDDDGVTWVNVSANDGSAGGLDATIGAGSVNNAEMAVASNGRIFVGVMQNGQLAYMGFSDNQGGSWTAMDLPETPEGGTFGDVGIQPAVRPGAQGAIHFSIAADPNNPNLVYVGGDTQSGDLFGANGNFIGARNFSGRLFRGDASVAATGAVPSPQWAHLTHSNAIGQTPAGGTASSSAPHADSRDIAFDANGELIEVDDGGVYRRTSPQDNTGDWFSLGNDLQVGEYHNLVYDTLSDIVVIGAQDNSTQEQVTPGSLQWRIVGSGDGGDVAVDTITLAAQNQSIRYSASQELRGAIRRVIDANNNIISTTPLGLLNGGTPLGLGQFVTPVVLNAVTPSRLIVGHSTGTFESTDMGDNVTELGTGIVVNDGLGADAISFGGFMGGVPNADVLYLGSGNNVLVRTMGTGAPMVAASYPGGFVRDIFQDPDNWMRVFVADNNSVYESTDAGATWTDITGNLVTAEIRSLEFITGPDRGVVVGTREGVFISADASLGTWNELDPSLPTVPVWDMDYDPVDDLLVVGTLGRGAWIFRSASQYAVTTVAPPPPPSAPSLMAIGDTLIGDEGDDTIIGADGNDLIFGGDGRDQLLGGRGEDTIFGENGNDLLDGGSDSDTLNGGGGNDTLTGGEGFDNIEWNGAGSGVDVVTTTVGGSEAVSVITSNTNNTVTLQENGNLLQVVEGSDSITVGRNTAQANITTRDGNDTVNISDLSDIDLLSIVIDTGDGNDVINGANAQVGLLRIVMNAGEGNDVVTGTMGNDIVNAGDGDDLVNGGFGNDTIRGDGGNDTLNGEGDHDSMDGGFGDDTLLGGDGHDTAVGGFGNDFIDGERGHDDVRGNEGNDIVVGSFGNDLVQGDNGNDSLFGGKGDDSIDGGNGDDFIRGHSGSDQIKGADGDDQITGDAGSDIIDGGDGNDVISDASGENTLGGGDGDDIIVGGVDKDTILAGDGHDIVYAGGGRDLIFGQDGDDTLRGNGSGDRFNSGEGADVLGDLGANETDNESLLIAQSILDAFDSLTF